MSIKIVAGIAGCVVALMLFEAVGRALYPKDVSRMREVDHRLAASRADTNRDGIRSTVEPGLVGDDSLNVIFLGDSFVYGTRLPPEEALPQRLERLARRTFSGRTVHVFNFGWVGSSPYLSFLVLN